MSMCLMNDLLNKSIVSKRFRRVQTHVFSNPNQITDFTVISQTKMISHFLIARNKELKTVSSLCITMPLSGFVVGGTHQEKINVDTIYYLLQQKIHCVH